jgi:bifunctional aspartokinase / homoserine dehydrogenase 1
LADLTSVSPLLPPLKPKRDSSKLKPVAPDAYAPEAAGFFITWEERMAKKMLVIKFGGSSVGNPQALSNVAGIIRSAKKDWGRVAVVVSAMGGVTDLLLAGAAAAGKGDSAKARRYVEAIRKQHRDAMEAGSLGDEIGTPINACLQELEGLYHAVTVLREVSPRALDAIASLGERMSIHIVSGYLSRGGVPSQPVEATEFLLTDAKFQNASPLMGEVSERARSILEPVFRHKLVPVITGFIGATREGVITTLGRGGSDYSAAIIGAAINAGEVWIYTDVDGVMTADPRQVPDARSLPSLSYREISEMAYYGAKVVHPKTIRPCVERNIPIRIKNTFHPDHPGTAIQANGQKASGVIKAVTANRDQTMVTVQGGGMMGVPGIAARTFATVARMGVSVTLITQASSEQSICFSVPSSSGKAVQTSLEEEFRREIDREDIDAIDLLEDCVIVTVVGAGMRKTHGVSGRIFSALGRAGINVVVIAQGSSECSISMVVDKNDETPALRAIHALLVSEQNAV